MKFNRYIKRLILLGIIYALYAIFFGGQANAFNFVVANQSDEKVTLRLNWWDHEIKEIFGPFSIHTGEYVPKKITVLDYDYSGHYYSVDVNATFWGFTQYVEFEYNDENPPKTISLSWDGCRVRHEIK